MNILAWTVIALIAFSVISGPYYFGEERKPYGYEQFLSCCVSALMIIPLALRVLGII